MRITKLFFIIICSGYAYLTAEDWRNVQERVKDSVVQVIVDRAVFNWLEPYKAPKMLTSYGSGFFWNNKIVTNFHVIKEAINVRIQLPALGRQQLKVRVSGVCPAYDVALLELAPDAAAEVTTKLGYLPGLELGDSDKVYRTQEVLAFGYPLGQQKLKATQGIISGRELIGDNRFYLQASTGLNPGNSGGPLVSNEGFVVGINTAISKRAQNISHILPVNDIKPYLQALTKHSFIQPPLLGAEFCFASKPMLEHLQVKSSGCYIARVFPDSLFDSLHLQEGDILTKVNNCPVDNFGEVEVAWSDERIPCSALIDRISEGQKLTVEFFRGGKKNQATSLLRYNDPRAVREMSPPFEKIDYEVFGGLVFMPLTLNHLEVFAARDKNAYKKLAYAALPEHQYQPRVIISHVQPGSPAQHARVFAAGDIIASINNTKIATIDDVRTALALGLSQQENQFITIKTADSKLFVVTKNDLVCHERMVQTKHHYKQSPMMLAAVDNYLKKRV